MDKVWSSLKPLSVKGIDTEEFRAPHLERSLPAVLPTAFDVLGINSGGRSLLPASMGYGALKKRGFRKILLFVIDSLGLDMLSRDAGYLARLHQAEGQWITSVFPTITSAAIVSLYHGRHPAQHGICGHNILFSEINGVVDTLKIQVGKKSRPLTEAGIDPSQYLWSDSLFTRKYLGDFRVMNVSPNFILNHGLSFFLYDKHVEQHGYNSTIEGLSKLKELLQHDGPGIYTYYYGKIDEICHHFGSESSQIRFQVEQAGEALGWLLRELPKQVLNETLLVLTADHGQCTFREGRSAKFSETDMRELLPLLQGGTPGISGRVLHLYPREGRETEVYQRVKAVAGPGGLLLDAKTSNLLSGGDAKSLARARDRLGNGTLILRDGYHYLIPGYSYENGREPNPYDIRYFISNHGSLTRNELLIPLVMTPLQAAREVLGAGKK